MHVHSCTLSLMRERACSFTCLQRAASSMHLHTWSYAPGAGARGAKRTSRTAANTSYPGQTERHAARQLLLPGHLMPS